MYPASLAGIPDGLCRGKEVFLVPGQTWPASLMPSEAPATFDCSDSDHGTALLEI